jgi:MFS family permease
MTSYRAIELGVPPHLLGLLAACFVIIPLVLAIPSGRATDRVGEKPIIVAGAVLLVISAAGYFTVSDTVFGLVVSSLILGLAHLLSVVGGQAIVGNLSPANSLDSAFGWYTFAASVGQTIGPLVLVVAGGTGQIPDASPVFLIATGAAVLTFVAAVLIRPQRRTAPPTGARGDSGRLGQVMAIPGLFRALMAAALIPSAVDILVVYLPALGAAAGLSVAAIGGLLALRSAASMISRLFLGRLVRRVGRDRLLVGSTVGAAVAIVLLGLPTSGPALAVGVLVAGFGLGMGQPLTMSWVVEATPAGLRGTALSLRLTGNRLGQIILPTLAGFLAGGSGVQGVFIVTAIALSGAAFASRLGTSPSGSSGRVAGPD